MFQIRNTPCCRSVQVVLFYYTLRIGVLIFHEQNGDKLSVLTLLVRFLILSEIGYLSVFTALLIAAISLMLRQTRTGPGAEYTRPTTADSARQPGDSTIVYVEAANYTGYHLVYFVGTDEMSYHDCLAEYGIGSYEDAPTGLRQPDYDEFEAELVAQFPVSFNKFVNWFAKV